MSHNTMEGTSSNKLDLLLANRGHRYVYVSYIDLDLHSIFDLGPELCFYAEIIKTIYPKQLKNNYDRH